MGLFDKRERELELQIKELNESVSLLEVRLKNEKNNTDELRDKISSLKGSILMKDIELVEKVIEIEECRKHSDLYKSELDQAKDTIRTNKMDIYILKGLVKENEKSIKQLKRINATLRKENTRLKEKTKSNAGRKSKINDDVIKQTEKLKSENKSLMQIANELEISTGVSYSKSTIKNIIDNYIKDRSVQK